MDIDKVPEGHIGARDAVLAVRRHLFGDVAPDGGIVAGTSRDLSEARDRAAADWLLGALKLGIVDASEREPGRFDGTGLQPTEAHLAGLPWFLRAEGFNAWLRTVPQPGRRAMSDAEVQGAMAAPFWNALQTVAWILLRDPQLVAQCADGVQDYGYSFEASPPGQELQLRYEPCERLTHVGLTMYAQYARGEGRPVALASTSEATAELLLALGEARLTAMGFRNNTGDLVAIGAEQWAELWLPEGQKYDAAPKQSLRAGASFWYKVKFKRAEVMALWRKDAGSSLASHGELADQSVDPYRTGGPGRPTVMHHVEREMRRRADAGESQDTLAAESSDLAAWVGTAHPTAPKPTARSIETQLRTVWHTLRKK